MNNQLTSCSDHDRIDNNDILSSPLVADSILKTKRQQIEARHKNKIWQRETDGKWLTHYYDRTGKRRKLERSSRADLLDALISLYDELDHSFTVREIYSTWIEECKAFKSVSPATIDRYDCDFRRFFEKSGFANCVFTKLTHGEVYSFVRSVVFTEGMTAKSFSNFRAVLRNIFLKAKIEGLTDISIRDVLDEQMINRNTFKKRKKSDQEQVFSDDEVEKITEYLREHPDSLNNALLLDFLTGLRSGELTALKKEDFVFGRYLHVQRTETKVKGQGENEGSTIVKEGTKTEAGDRMVYLSAEAASIVVRQISDPECAESEWLFLGPHNHKRIIRSSVRRRLEHVCRMCDVPKRSPHKIRKTYASRLIDAGVDDNIITAQMGHEDIKTTKEYYYFTHQSEEVKAKQLEKAVSGF